MKCLSVYKIPNMNIGSWDEVNVNGILIKISLFKSREAFRKSR